MIQVFVTGGTFDKEYNFIDGQLYFKDTHLNEMFERGRSSLNIDIKTIMMVDSLEMTEADRNIIVYQCKKALANKILITHGTDRMVSTAKALAEGGVADKTIVITGAMIPYAFGNSSDGFFNLGAALAFVQVLSPGIYIAMNGKYFPWNDVKKNYDTGFFEKLSE